jgi:hypothetical protein
MASSGGSSSGGASSSSGSAGAGCTATFGADAAAVTGKTCSQLGPFRSDSTAFTWSGDAEGLDAPIYAFTLKYPNGVTAKTYETKDLYYVSANCQIAATSKTYYLDFDSTDASKERHGTATTVFTSPEHRTIDMTFDSDDTPPRHATVHLTF